MQSLFKTVALLVAITCLVWLGVLWHWQSTRRVMSTADIVVYLGVLPLVCFVLALLGQAAWAGAQRSEQRRQAERAAANAANTPAHTGDHAPARDPRAAPLLVWATALQCAAGRDAASLLTALQSGEPRPAPQVAWRDEHGLPVICAAIDELDLSAGEALWHGPASVAPTSPPHPATPATPPDASVIRALAALAPALEACCVQLSERLEAEAGRPGPTVRLITEWPAHWSAAERTQAHQAVHGQLQALLGRPIHAVAPSTGTDEPPPMWQRLDRLAEALDREQRDDLVLLVAAQSDLSEVRLAQIERGAGLLSGHHPKGQLPGESAAVLALSLRDWLGTAPEAAASPPVALLHRPAWQVRDKSVDAPGRIQATVAEAAVDQALQVAGVAAPDILALIGDADQHTGRATELFGTLISRLPHLDAAQDTLLTGPLLGRTGPCAWLVGLALACHRSAQDDAPVLTLSVDHPLHRIAFVVRPPSQLLTAPDGRPAVAVPSPSAVVSA